MTSIKKRRASSRKHKQVAPLNVILVKLSLVGPCGNNLLCFHLRSIKVLVSKI